MSEEDRAALEAIRAREGDAKGLPSDSGCPGSDDDIPMARLDVIVSVSGRAVRIHLDPNAPGSVQATGEVGSWRGGKFTAHGERREVKKVHADYASAKKKAES